MARCGRRKIRSGPQRHRQQQHSAGRELPGGEGQQRYGRTPLAREHRATGHRNRSGQARRNPRRIQPHTRREHQQGHTRQTGQGSQHRGRPQRAAQHPGRKKHHHQRLHGPDGGGRPSRQAVGRDEQHAPEHREIERSQNEHPQPPHALRQAPCKYQQQQACGQRAQQGHGHRGHLRQQLGGDDVAAAPDGGCQRRQQQIARLGPPERKRRLTGAHANSST